MISEAICIIETSTVTWKEQLCIEGSGIVKDHYEKINLTPEIGGNFCSRDCCEKIFIMKN